MFLQVSGETTKDVDSTVHLLNLRQVDTKKFLQFLSQQGIVKSIKLYCDWFRTDPETMKACSKSSKTLLGKLVAFLNLITFEEELFFKGWHIIFISLRMFLTPLRVKLILKNFIFHFPEIYDLLLTGTKRNF